MLDVFLLIHVFVHFLCWPKVRIKSKEAREKIAHKSKHTQYLLRIKAPSPSESGFGGEDKKAVLRNFAADLTLIDTFSFQLYKLSTLQTSHSISFYNFCVRRFQ